MAHSFSSREAKPVIDPYQVLAAEMIAKIRRVGDGSLVGLTLRGVYGDPEIVNSLSAATVETKLRHGLFFDTMNDVNPQMPTSNGGEN